jgi:hypothetical protein
MDCYGSELPVLAHVIVRAQKMKGNRDRLVTKSYGECPDCGALFRLSSGLLPRHRPGISKVPKAFIVSDD